MSGQRRLKRKRCQDSFLGLPRGQRVDWRFRCREIACTQFPSPKGEPRLTLVRTALSSAAVSGLLTRSAHRGERAMGQAESRRGSRSGSSSHRFSDPHVQSSAPSDQSRPQGVALDVQADQQEVFIILDRIANVERPSRPVHRSVGPGDPTYTTAVVLLACVSEIHRKKLLMPPSSVGCSTKCQ